jgi:16S rRNA (guanine527-N7)-methyltransferase
VTSAGGRAAPDTAGSSEGDGVSRETQDCPEAPLAAQRYFGPSLAKVDEYARLLAGTGVVRGLIGPREVPRLWERHLLNCAVVQELIPNSAAVDDVGSGAGLPGIVLALCRPDVTVTLVEPLLRRTAFLEEVVSELALGNVLVVRQRAEERAAARRGADVVTARAVAPLDRLAGWTLPLLRPGGVLLALKGSRAQDELVAAAAAIRAAGGVEAEVLEVGAEHVQPPTTVVRIRRGSAPRETGRVDGRGAARSRAR